MEDEESRIVLQMIKSIENVKMETLINILIDKLSEDELAKFIKDNQVNNKDDSLPYLVETTDGYICTNGEWVKLGNIKVPHNDEKSSQNYILTHYKGD